MSLLGTSLADAPRRKVRRRKVGYGELDLGRTGRAVGEAFALAAFLAAAAGIMIALHEYRIPFLQLWVVIMSLLLIRWVVGTLAAPAPPAPRFDASSAELPPVPPFHQVDRWERRLSTTAGDPKWFAWAVRDRISVVADERLRQHHGVRLSASSDRARAILGEELHDFLTEPAAEAPDPAGLGRYLTRIEEI